MKGARPAAAKPRPSASTSKGPAGGPKRTPGKAKGANAASKLAGSARKARPSAKGQTASESSARRPRPVAVRGARKPRKAVAKRLGTAGKPTHEPAWQEAKAEHEDPRGLTNGIKAGRKPTIHNYGQEKNRAPGRLNSMTNWYRRAPKPAL